MSIVCALHDDEPLRVVDQAYCVTTFHSNKYSAICQAVVDSIPDEAKYSTSQEGGLDFHILFSTPNGLLPQYLSLLNMRPGDYKFSIDHATAVRYYPELLELHQSVT